MKNLEVKDKRFEFVDLSTLDSDLVVRPNISYWQDGEDLRRILLLWAHYLY